MVIYGDCSKDRKTGPNKYEKEVPPNEEVPKMKVETAATTPDTVDDSVIDLDAAKE